MLAIGKKALFPLKRAVVSEIEILLVCVLSVLEKALM